MYAIARHAGDKERSDDSDQASGSADVPIYPSSSKLAGDNDDWPQNARKAHPEIAEAQTGEGLSSTRSKGYLVSDVAGPR